MIDGRYDSARGVQHCTVTAIEYNAHLVVGICTLRPKIEGKASKQLEAPAVVRLLRGLLAKGLRSRTVISNDCATLGPQLQALDIAWQKDCHHKIKNIRKHFQKILTLKEAKRVSNPHQCVSESKLMSFTKKEMLDALATRFGSSTLTLKEERLKKSEFVAIVLQKMCPFGTLTNAQRLTVDLDGVTEFHAHEVGMWFLCASQLCRDEGGDAETLHRDIMMIAEH
ncbi:hypothetical protein CBR_g26456 [Chara braunii]|uniref:Uncharacterized protein n=1 Tax=Chara braunii TaxID=69332 RepID=A0A388L810_CHABU|nr:hypothetical protein CBR_g26456 [Chara braunii]|eukprot:GBG78427.1 hypothetical protein CBR_g26456 [Chara braunii]